MFREIGAPLHVVALPPLVPRATVAAAEGGGCEDGGGEGGGGEGGGGEGGGGEGGGGEGGGGEGGGEATGLRLFAEYTAVVCRPDAYVALRVWPGQG